MGAKKFRNGVKNSPPSLQLLSARATLRMLENACKSPQNVTSTKNLRHECATSTPCTLRQLMLEELLRSGRLYNTLQLYVLDTLLTPDIRRLSVRHVRRWYRSNFLDLLTSGRAVGLEVFLFEDITWLNGNPIASAPLAVALNYLPNLRQVSFRFVCDDIILGSLGRTCPNLEEIDASGSSGVTDVGVQRLCIKAYTNVPKRNDARRKGAWRAARRFCRRVFFDCFLETALDEHTSLPNWWRASVIRRARKNACCDTLRVVNITATRVTSQGMELVQASVPAVRIIATTLTNRLK